MRVLDLTITQWNEKRTALLLQQKQLLQQGSVVPPTTIFEGWIIFLAVKQFTDIFPLHSSCLGA